jgi:methionyl-tRNA synthetase
MPNFYITTAIDYSNGDPHLGHALEKVGADAIARYRRLRGDDVLYVMGMDEHGQKVAMAAEKAGVAPQEWVDRFSERFNATWRSLHCSHDDWIRTTQPRHFATVTAFIERIQAVSPDDFFFGEYEGLYCVGCEEFKQESQIVEGRCIEHPSRDLVHMQERNCFFRLSRWRDELLRLITSGEFKVEPAIRRNEIVRVLEDGLQDISVSRSRFPWGIPFPGVADQTVYVWVDALINYLSVLEYPKAGWEQRWPAGVHVVGKGITRFHCIIWPALLLSAGLPLPRKVWAHGYVQWGGAKVSKSEGVSVSLDEAIARHGPDPLRYYLLREVGFENDGDFTFERFDARYTADLADGLGNLLSRSLAMIEKYRAGTVPDSAEITPLELFGAQTVASYAKALDALDLKGGAEAAWTLVTRANQYIVETAPWTLAKEGKDAELDAVLHALAACLYRLAVLASPYLPAKAEALWTALGQPGAAARSTWKLLGAPPVSGTHVTKGEGLFPKAAPPAA